MSEEEVLLDTQQPEEELDLAPEGEQETTPEVEDVETLKARNEELEKKNKQLYARLKKTNGQPQPSIKKDDIGEAGTRLSRLELAEAKRQFAWEHNLSPDETDKVFSITAKPTKETLDDPFIKAGLQAIRAAKRVEEATPSPSGKSTKVDGKVWAEMSKEDRQKNYQKVVHSMTGRK